MNEIKKVVNSKANVIKLLSVSETAPINCIQGDMYYNTSTNLIYISNATNTWSEEGQEPIEGYLYVDLEKAKMYYYDGTFFANYGGTSNEIVISPEEPTTEDWKIWIDTNEINNLGSEVVDTLDGNETNKAPSVNAINKLHTYSTEETRIGTFLGKPLYRKTINFGALLNSAEKEVEHNINNIETVIKIYGFTTTGVLTFPIPLASTTPTSSIYCFERYGKITVGTGSDRTEYTKTYMTIEYTKTTDIATIDEEV